MPHLDRIPTRLGGPTSDALGNELRTAARSRLSTVLGVARSSRVGIYHCAVPLVLFAALFAPFAVRQNAWYEWANYLWLIQQQALNVRSAGVPSLFIHTHPGGVFYPWFAFYGASLWGLSAYLAIALASAWLAFLVVIAASFAAAYTGAWWLSRQAGLSRVEAHIPAVVVVASPYIFVANLYGRGDWAEATALGFLPLVFAGAVATATGRRPRLGATAVFIGSAVIAASHNITLLWGTAYCLAIAVILLAGAHGTRALPAGRSLAAIAGAALLGVLLSAWFLVPDIVYAHETRIYGVAPSLITRLSAFDQLRVIFWPWPVIPRGAQGTMRLQAPVYPLLWAIFALAFAARSLGPMGRRWAAGIGGLSVVTVALLVHDQTWTHFPLLVQSIQFPLRLHSYLVLLVAGLVLLGLRGTRGLQRGRAWLVAGVLAAGGQAALTIGVAWTTQPSPHVRVDAVSPTVVPVSFPTGQQQQFRLPTKPHVNTPRMTVAISPRSAQTGVGVATRPDVTAGAKFDTNIVASPLVHVSGTVSPIGRDADGQVVVVARAAGIMRIQASAADPWPVVVGDGLSLLGLALAAGVGLWWYWPRRRAAR